MPDICPRCGSSLREQGGAVVRPIDIDFDATLARLDELTRKRVRTGPIVALAIALPGLLPPLAPISAIVLAVLQYFWARFLVARPYARFFSPGRRIVTRWVSRIALLLLGLLHFAAVAPVVQLVVSPLLFFGLSAAARGYFRFHFLRERRREPVHPLEKVLVVVLVATVVLAFVVLVLVLVLVAKVFDEF